MLDSIAGVLRFPVSGSVVAFARAHPARWAFAFQGVLSLWPLALQMNRPPQGPAGLTAHNHQSWCCYRFNQLTMHPTRANLLHREMQGSDHAISRERHLAR